MRRFLLATMIVVGLLALSSPSLNPRASASAGKSLTDTTVSVPGNKAFSDTGINLTQGSSVSITASGTIYIAASDPGKTPAGDPSCIADSSYVGPGLPCWSLIGWIGNSVGPFEVGTSTSFTASASGDLYLGVNDNDFSDNSGSWTATVTVTTPTWDYDPGSYGGKSGSVSIGHYNEPDDTQHVNYCGPGASRVLISAWTSNVPDIETLATQEKTNQGKVGTYITDMVDPINSAIGQNYYSVQYAGSQKDFSNMIGRDILDNHHPLITGIKTQGNGYTLNGWNHAADHIITIYGFDFTSPTVGYVYYYETSGKVAGTTATGTNSLDYNAFWSLVTLNNIQLS